MLWNEFLEQISPLGTEEFFRFIEQPCLLSSNESSVGAQGPTPEKIALPAKRKESTRLDLLPKSLNSDIKEIFFITKTKFTIGREIGCDVVFDNIEISRRHAQFNYLECYGGVWGVYDQCSRNGTYVNGERVKYSSRILDDGDVVTLGQSIVLTYKKPVGLWKMLKAEVPIAK